MRILLVAPQPFFAERGTPIAVRLLAEELCALGHAVDLLCYHEGEDVALPGLRLLRAGRPPLVRDVPIGFSWKKLACDAFLVAAMARLLRRGRYDIVHAVEEAVFPAVLLGRRAGAAVVWDLDSDLVDQLLGTRGWLRPLRGALAAIEGAALGRCRLALAVCPSLAAMARRLAPDVPVRVLEDVPLLEGPPPEVEDLRSRYRVSGSLGHPVRHLAPPSRVPSHIAHHGESVGAVLQWQREDGGCVRLGRRVDAERSASGWREASQEATRMRLSIACPMGVTGSRLIGRGGRQEVRDKLGHGVDQDEVPADEPVVEARGQGWKRQQHARRHRGPRCSERVHGVDAHHDRDRFFVQPRVPLEDRLPRVERIRALELLRDLRRSSVCIATRRVPSPPATPTR